MRPVSHDFSTASQLANIRLLIATCIPARSPVTVPALLDRKSPPGLLLDGSTRIAPLLWYRCPSGVVDGVTPCLRGILNALTADVRRRGVDGLGGLWAQPGGGLARTACRLPDTQHRRFSDAGCGGHCGPAGRIHFVGVRVGRSRPSRSCEGHPFKTAALAAEVDEQ